MAPVPARAHGTTAPTARNLLATATPNSPVFRSEAAMENVDNRASGLGLRASSEFVDLILAMPLFVIASAAKRTPSTRRLLATPQIWIANFRGPRHCFA